MSSPTKAKVVHYAHYRGGCGSLYDSKCGVWWPKNVTTFIQDCTCKSCLRVYAAEQKNLSQK